MNNECADQSFLSASPLHLHLLPPTPTPPHTHTHSNGCGTCRYSWLSHMPSCTVVISWGNRYEVTRFPDRVPRSWFVGNTVQEDGALHLATPMDPTLLVLPRLQVQLCIILCNTAPVCIVTAPYHQLHRTLHPDQNIRVLRNRADSNTDRI